MESNASGVVFNLDTFCFVTIWISFIQKKG